MKGTSDVMNGRQLIRTGGWAGIAFLVLDIVGQAPLVSHADSTVNAPISTVVSYYSSHRHQVTTAVVILAVAAIFLIWFLGAVYQWLRATPAAGDPAPAAVLLSGSVVTGLFLLERIPQAVLSLMAGQPGGLSADLTVRALADMQAVLTSAMFVATAVVVLAIPAGLVRRGAVGAWLTWIGGVSAALFLASGLAGYVVLDSNAWNTSLHLGDLGLAVIVVMAAVTLIRRPAPASQPVSGGVTA